MTACAADDHLNLIATAATSDGGIEKIDLASSDSTDTRGATSVPHNSSSRAGKPSSCVHVWDAEMMTLVGTLPIPCLALTRELAKTDTIFARSRALKSPEAQTSGKRIQGTVGGSSTSEVRSTRSRLRGALPCVTSTRGKALGGACDAVPGKSEAKFALITALQFLSPLPLLVGSSTDGGVLLWRVTDCVCVQVSGIVLQFLAHHNAAACFPRPMGLLLHPWFPQTVAIMARMSRAYE